MPKGIDLTDQRFGRLLAIKLVETGRRRKWLCVCDCGNETVVKAELLRSGKTNSCGCLQKETVSHINTTHGKHNHKLYAVWASLRQRCNNPSDKSYKYYGGRGIKVCKEWDSEFTPFYEWAISNGYKDGLSIDRINVDKDYSPDNCRWVTMKAQMNNTRRNRKYTINDETHTLSEWCDLYHTYYSLVKSRLYRGYSLIEALTISKGEKRKGA